MANFTPFAQPAAPVTQFTNNPSPTTGTNAFGYIPGQTNNPIPNAPALNTTAGNDILSKLSGTLSPGTVNALDNASAEFGITSGLGVGSGIGANQLYGNIANASENQQQQGLSDYNQITGPSFQTNLAQNNANLAAAPDPSQAASYAQQLYDQYLRQMNQNRSPAGGTGGSSTSATPPTPFNTSSAFPDNPPAGTPSPNFGLLESYSSNQPTYNDFSNPDFQSPVTNPASFSDFSNEFLNPDTYANYLQ